MHINNLYCPRKDLKPAHRGRLPRGMFRASSPHNSCKTPRSDYYEKTTNVLLTVHGVNPVMVLATTMYGYVFFDAQIQLFEH